MISFLKKLGQILVSAAGVASGVGPIVLPLLGSSKNKVATDISTGINDLTAIGQTTLQIETAFANIPNSTGEQKLQALMPLTANILKTSELIAGKKIANETLFTKAVQEISQGVVDMLNSVDPAEATKAA